MPDARPDITLAMTGASGAGYGLRLLECLLAAGHNVHLLLSRPAQIVIGTETDLRLPGRPAEIARALAAHFSLEDGRLHVYGNEEWTAPVASGSGAPHAMVVCPCSSATLSAIASGASRGLLERAADVVLKERGRLILVHRETPLSLLHIDNMRRATEAGAIILPANPGFYQRPASVADLIDFVVARILDRLDVPHALQTAWGRDDPE